MAFQPLFSAGDRVLLWSDCLPFCQAFERGHSREPSIAALLRALASLSVLHDVHLRVQHISGVDNILADHLSRFRPLPRFVQLCEERGLLPDGSFTRCPPWPRLQ
jgi:hypothetical protein